MRIRQIRGNGYPCWPPVWIGNILENNNEEAVLQQVALISGTTLLKVEFGQDEEKLVGLLIFEKDMLDSAYQKLKANIGRPLTEVGDLELDC